MKKLWLVALVLLLGFALGGCKEWYLDADGDGFGDPEISVNEIVQPAGYVLDNTDCNDDVPTVYPGAPELMDNIDNQCPGDLGFGTIDEQGGKEPKIEDFSSFDIFHYEESGALLGFCPAVDTIHTATITKKEDGYYVEMSIIRVRSDAPEGCPDNGAHLMIKNELISGQDPCFELVQLPSRILTESEEQEMEGLFASIMLVYIDYLKENPLVDGICVDPCLNIVIGWDRYFVYQQVATCYHKGEYHERIDSGSLQQIMSFLNSLR